NLSLAGALTDAGLQAVKNAVVGSAANLECKDLAKGIVTVHGYESEGEGLDLEKLAAMIPEYGLESSDDPKGMDKAGKLQQEIDEAFKGKVFPLIRSYIDGKFVKGREATALDKEMSEAVMNHCESYLTGEIEKLRKETIQKKKDLLKEVRSNLESVKITGYGSNRTRPVTDEVVGLEVRLSVADLDGFIKTQEKKLQEMGAGDVWLRPEYSWKVSPLDDRGKKGTIGASNANSRLTSLWKFKFKEAGDYRLQAVIDIKSSEKIFGRWGEISVTLSKDFTLKLLPGAASFTACVVNEKGEAVQNASLRLDGPPKSKPLVEMAEKGCCTFEKVVPDQYSLHVEAKGYPSKSVPFDFRHPEKVAKPFKITLAAGLAALQVQVRKVIDTRQTQKPVPGAQVTVEAAEGQFKGAKALLEQEGGKHVTELTPGKYLLRAGAPGYRAPDGKDAVTESLEIPSPTSEKERKTVEKTLFLAPTQGEISVVVLEKGGESKPIPDAEVKLIQPDGSSWDFQRVEGSGRIVFKDLNPGTNYAVQARAEFY
ncbi:MAG TPA: carboxypeptidase-like regulatory domain-containing protein, partial [Syntrophobacteraceae bacterium]|nr:carboxypeptidase-like regulatory domain-containing protein [Syntrophobacteraceae bacterium]